MSVGRKIKIYREAAHLTQEQLAEKLSIPRTNIAQFETEKRIPNFPVVSDIAKILDVPLEKFQ